MSKADDKSEDTQSLSDVADCDSARQSPSQHANSKGLLTVHKLNSTLLK